jgi:antitoxin component of MazEF toxin-antitoxin module
MRVQARVRRIGNSLGVVIPKEEAKLHDLREGDLVAIEIEREAGLDRLFGSLTFSKTTQELKDEMRSDWGD